MLSIKRNEKTCPACYCKWSNSTMVSCWSFFLKFAMNFSPKKHNFTCILWRLNEQLLNFMKFKNQIIWILKMGAQLGPLRPKKKSNYGLEFFQNGYSLSSSTSHHGWMNFRTPTTEIGAAVLFHTARGAREQHYSSVKPNGFVIIFHSNFEKSILHWHTQKL